MHRQRQKRHGDPLEPGRVRLPNTCAVAECQKPARVRGLCPTHYTRWKRHGDPLMVLNPKQEGESYERRRQRMRARQGRPYVDRDIFERDGWVCQLCFQPIDPTLSRKSPMGASIDHVVPLIRGGAHCAENVQASHLVCNFRKGKG